jgi:hypothetical protein
MRWPLAISMGFLGLAGFNFLSRAEPDMTAYDLRLQKDPSSENCHRSTVTAQLSHFPKPAIVHESDTMSIGDRILNHKQPGDEGQITPRLKSISGPSQLSLCFECNRRRSQNDSQELRLAIWTVWTCERHSFGSQ